MFSIFRYPELLFEQELEQCADLCLQLLRHGAGRMASVSKTFFYTFFYVFLKK